MTAELIDYLTALLSAKANFEALAISCVPKGTPIIVRQNDKDIYIEKGTHAYDRAYEKFIEDISDIRAETLLSFLYLHHYCYQADIEIFSRRFRSKFSEKQWIPVRHFFPKLSQTAVGLTTGIPNSVTACKLLAFERAGLVKRHSPGAPFPTYTTITDKGCGLIEAHLGASAAILKQPLGAFIEQSEGESPKEIKL